MWERRTFVLTSCRSNFSLPLIPVRFQSLQMLDDEIFSTKNCACGMARISCGVAPLLFALRIRVCILQPCLTLPHISWNKKRHPFIDHIDPWFCWISKMFPVPSDTIFPYVLPLTLPPLVTCIILHHLAISCLYILLAYSCLLTSSQSLGQKNSAAEKSAERSGASAKNDRSDRFQSLSQIFTSLQRQCLTTFSLDLPLVIVGCHSHHHVTSCDIMWHLDIFQPPFCMPISELHQLFTVLVDPI